MRLLRADCEELKLETFNDERKLPKYAILSHVWLPADEEITFQYVTADIEGLRARAGWEKLNYTRKQASQDGYKYCWIDTCCIDKSSSAELAEAINSMYRWYNLAEMGGNVCYDVETSTPLDTLAKSPLAFRECGRFVPTDKHGLHLDHSFELVDKGVRFDLSTRWVNRHPRIRDPRHWLQQPLFTSRRLGSHIYGLAERQWARPDFYPEEMLVALNCCFEENPTHTLTLLVRKVSDTRDTYFATRCSVVSTKRSTWRNTEACPNVTRRFTVLHRATQARRRPLLQLNEEVISCCLSHRSDPGFEIASAEPAENWHRDSSSFFLRQAENGGFPEKPFHGSVVLRKSLAGGATIAFVLHMSISKDDKGWWHTLLVDGHDGARVFKLPLTPFSNIIITRTPETWDYSLVIGSEFEVKSLNHQETILVQANAVTVRTPLICWLVLMFASRVILTLSFLPLAVVLPVFIPVLARWKGYKAGPLADELFESNDGLHASALTMSPTERYTLVVSFAVTSALGIWLLLHSKLHLQWSPISWQLPMLWLLRTASLVTGLLLAILFGLHTATLPPGIWLRLPFLIAAFLMTSLEPLTESDVRRNLSIIFLSLLPLLNVITLAPFGVAIVDRRDWLLPWTLEFCKNHDIPGPVSCNDAAVLGWLSYISLTLGSYLALLEVIAVLQRIFLPTRSIQEAMIRRNRLQKFADRCRPWLNKEKGQKKD